MSPFYFMALVYQHRRKDTSEIFYIGVGNDYYRPYAKSGRNKHWHNIVNKTGYDVEIIAENISYEEALSKEIELVAFYGRHDKKLGSLVNMTDGGEGSIGFIMSIESRDKIKLIMVGRCWINNREISKLVKSSDLDKYLNNGWFLGNLVNQSLGKHWINNREINKLVKSSDLDKYLNNGWFLGMLKDYQRQQKIVACPHCSKEGGINNMQRWHFDNCKQKSTTTDWFSMGL